VITLAIWVSLELSRLTRQLPPPPPASRLRTLPVGPPRPVDPKTKQPLTHTPPTNPRGDR
jgi:hypothetical protein